MPKPIARRERAGADANAGDSRRGAWNAVCVAWRRTRQAAPAVLAVATVGAIFINALFLQPGPHPAPIFAVRPPPSVGEHAPRPAAAMQKSPAPEATGTIAVLPRPRPPELAARSEPVRRDLIAEVERGLASRPKAKTMAVASAPAPSDEPAAGLVVPVRQVMAVQRALSEFGYGQVKPSGVYDPETRAAIEAFESARRLPVTGQITDRLMRELVTMTGRSLN